MLLEIEKVLVISTNHITEKDMNTLEMEFSSFPFHSTSTGYGRILHIEINLELPPKTQSIQYITSQPMPAWTDDFSEAFLDVMRLAVANKCAWVHFDRDGSEYDELPKFDW